MVDIKDAPKYDWRGFHIDVVRHMFTVDYLKKVIDCLSFYKINKLHLHLTDDQGWRIEVKKYPLLTQEGSWRDFDEYDKRCVELSQQDYNYEIDPPFREKRFSIWRSLYAGRDERFGKLCVGKRDRYCTRN